MVGLVFDNERAAIGAGKQISNTIMPVLGEVERVAEVYFLVLATLFYGVLVVEGNRIRLWPIILTFNHITGIIYNLIIRSNQFPCYVTVLIYNLLVHICCCCEFLNCDATRTNLKGLTVFIDSIDGNLNLVLTFIVSACEAVSITRLLLNEELAGFTILHTLEQFGRDSDIHSAICFILCLKQHIIELFPLIIGSLLVYLEGELTTLQRIIQTSLVIRKALFVRGTLNKALVRCHILLGIDGDDRVQRFYGVDRHTADVQLAIVTDTAAVDSGVVTLNEYATLSGIYKLINQ